jgi:hypothetical protein
MAFSKSTKRDVIFGISFFYAKKLVVGLWFVTIENKWINSKTCGAIKIKHK